MLKKIIEFFEKHKRISFVFVLIVIGTMWYFSSIPGISAPGLGFSWMPIIYHFSIFAAFAFFFFALIAKKQIKAREILIALFVSLIVAILDEFHQYFVPLRSCTIQDVLIDMTGAILLTSIYLLIKKIKISSIKK